MLRFALLLADEKTTSWLTPVWLMSLTLTLGLLFYLVSIGLIYSGTFLPGLNRLNDDRRTRITSGVIISLLFAAIAIGGSFLAGWWKIDTRWVDPAERVELIDRESATVANYQLMWIVLSLLIAPLIGFGLVAVFSARRRNELLASAREGLSFWLGCVCLGGFAFLLFGLLMKATGGLGLVTVVDNPQLFFDSLTRIRATGTFEREFEIPVSTDGDTGYPIDVHFRGGEFRWIQFDSTQPVKIAAEEFTPDLSINKYYDGIVGLSTIFYTTVSGETVTPIPNRTVDHLYVVNQGDQPARLRVRWQTEPPARQVIIVAWMAVLVLAFFLVILLFVAAAPKTSAIALATFKTEVAQPIFLILILIGTVAILLSVYIPYYTLGEDIKMYKESGLTLIRVMGIFLATWSASKSVAEEIEGRTALTVLSKPIGRTQFVIGKYVGIAMTVSCLFLLLGLWFYIWTAYKPVYDTVETAQRLFDWEICFSEAYSILPGLLLALFEALIFVAISVAISTRVGIMPNFLITFSIYVLGHLTPNLVQSNVGEIEQVRFVGQVITILLPVLDHFDVTTAIMTNAAVPPDYLGWAAIYCALYTSIMLLLGLIFFQDRDLA